jgi:hypothetical protein
MQTEGAARQRVRAQQCERYPGVYLARMVTQCAIALYIVAVRHVGVQRMTNLLKHVESLPISQGPPSLSPVYFGQDTRRSTSLQATACRHGAGLRLEASETVKLSEEHEQATI